MKALFKSKLKFIVIIILIVIFLDGIKVFFSFPGGSLLMKDFNAVYWVFLILFHSIFVIGLYLLSFKYFRDWRICYLVILFSFFYRSGFGFESWGLHTGIILPRQIIMAVSPFLFLYFLDNFNKFKIGILYFVLGLLVNMHPLSSGSLLLVFSLANILVYFKEKSLIKKGVNLLFGWSLFFIGALPFLFTYFNEIDIYTNFEVLKFRVPALFINTPNGIMAILRGVIYLIIPLIIGYLGWRKIDKEIKIHNITKNIFISIYLVGIVGGFIVALSPKLMYFQLFRVTTYLYPFIFIYASFFIISNLTGKSRLWKKILPLGIILLIAIPVIEVSSVKIINSGLEEKFHKSKLQLDNEKVKIIPELEYVEDISNWVRENTKKDSLFLIPPKGFYYFVYKSERSVFVSFKGGYAVGLSEDVANEWFSRYIKVVNVYLANSTEKFKNLCEANKIDYVIVDNKKNKIKLLLMYENKYYKVYGCQ